ncbi:tetratricopeptide repeat protein, partial [Bizionia psychrotolerans]|uniref:tetratricopeptide repeat protein n=1 Tax=Bizionia psychrotolerans TaxID=1492901 RepID=UPI00065162CB
MIIIIPVDDFSNTIFSNPNQDKEQLINKLKEFYKIGSVFPTITDEGEFLKIEMDFEKVEIESEKFTLLLNLCENKKFDDALNLAKELVSDYPSVSEYHRLLGQIYSDLGEQDEAINTLIDSLRWNPTNEWALLMMGNIFARYKGDLETSFIYYKQILEHYPNSFITLNNIGAVLMQKGESDEALKYFNKAREANPEYPNTYLALGLLSEKKCEYLEAFNFSIKAIRLSTGKGEVFENSFQLAIKSAREYSEHYNNDIILNAFIKELSKKGEKDIQVISDSDINTAAKIEFAENYDRNYHLVKHKPNYESVSHLIMHELSHLELV